MALMRWVEIPNRFFFFFFLLQLRKLEINANPNPNPFIDPHHHNVKPTNVPRRKDGLQEKSCKDKISQVWSKTSTYFQHCCHES